MTSVPPRFERLGPVLRALLAQEPGPEAVYLCLPEQYERFPGAFDTPDMPEGVTVLRCGLDIGPGMKLLGALGEVTAPRLIYCDDDWVPGPGWAAALLAAQGPGEAVTGQGFGVERLGRVLQAMTGCCDIAQGFSGVLVEPRWFDGLTPPEGAALRAVDDIWLSAHLAAKGVPIRVADAARGVMRPAFDDAHGLQDAEVGGIGRAEANRACVEAMAARYGIWPSTA